MVLVATQVKRRRGTTAENDAFTGAEGEITVDTEKHELRVHDGVTQGGFKIGGGSGSGRNIGDIFYTARTDESLAGAVECDGGTYNTEDYEGDGSIGELLEAGKLPYVSMSQYATLLSTNGSVGVFGWNGSGNTEFRVPSLNDIFIETGTAAQIGDYIAPAIPNIRGKLANYAIQGTNASGAFYATDTVGSSAYDSSNHSRQASNAVLDASRSSSVYKNGTTTVQPKAIKYRAMIQLFNGTTDEAVATVGTVVAQVGALNSHRLIDFQIPTAENGYTWYRKYKSGWVEQGGQTESSGGSTAKNITFPVAMVDTNYTAQVTIHSNLPFGSAGNNAGVDDNQTTTGMTVYSGNTGALYWQVSGMSAQ